ncbi:MAG TPA: endonuclease/exonuclease/phosphatase family protein [Hanamia sp.]|nr:endonuclease/exonuclease/phosphatase family protein [Hanamia sp.]
MEKPFLRRFTKKVFIITNVLVALLALAGANVKYFDPVKWWFLSVLTIALPYLLLLLVLFMLFWFFLKSGWCLISLVTVGISFHAVKNIVAFNLRSHFSLEKKPGNIRVMSWNVEQFNILHYKDRPDVKQQMFDLINQYDPDIACFQEVVAGENKKAINYFPAIRNALHFKDYLYSYQLKDDFDHNHHFGITVFSKYPILRKQTIVNNPNNYNSTFQFIDVLVGEDTLRIFNVHLQSLKFSKENLNYLDKGSLKTNATSESRSILSKIKTGVIKRASQAFFIKDEMNHSPYPIVVCGDFNDVPVSYAYETIGAGLQNAFVQKGFGISRTFSTLSPTLRIDNIFADRDFRIIQYTRVKKLLSDHFPIIADLRFKPVH